MIWHQMVTNIEFVDVEKLCVQIRDHINTIDQYFDWNFSSMVTMELMNIYIELIQHLMEDQYR